MWAAHVVQMEAMSALLLVLTSTLPTVGCTVAKLCVVMRGKGERKGEDDDRLLSSMVVSIHLTAGSEAVVASASHGLPRAWLFGSFVPAFACLESHRRWLALRLAFSSLPRLSLSKSSSQSDNHQSQPQE